MAVAADMNDTRYRFAIGTFACMVANDGTMVYHDPALALFANAPRERLAQLLHAHGIDLGQWSELLSPYSALLIQTGKHLVLVDTGAGNLGPTTGKLPHNLRTAGVVPQDIDVVLLTHAHIDHIGGALDGAGKPMYPNARYVMWRKEWNFWTLVPDLSRMEADERVKESMVAYARRNLRLIQSHLELVDAETDIVPGIRAVATPGHTPGHIAVAISSGNEHLYYISDAALHPIHLERPDWYATVDVEPQQALASRRRLLERAAAEKALVQASHFPFPGLGHVTQKGDAWQWQPWRKSLQ
jgi:glyoxylase-like metal-dependent hydrolase (beta-lactamase superfamily II)